MKVKIEIDTITFVRFWLVVIGFALSALAIFMARSALILVVVSFFLALALNVPVNFLVKFMPGRSRLGGTATAYIIIVGLLTGFLFLVLPPLIEQSVHFAESIPDLIDKNKDQINSINNLVNQYHLQEQVDQAINSIKNNASQLATNIGVGVVTGIGSVLGVVISVLLVLVMTFLMLLEGPSWLRRYWNMYTNEDRKAHHQMLAKKMYRVMSGYVNGQLAVAAIGGVSAGIFVAIIPVFIQGAPGNLALPVAAIAFLLSLIPMFGATIAGVLITLMLLLSSVPAAVTFVIYFIVYQQIENNFISPVIQAKTIQLSALVVLLSVTLGTYIFGLIGGLISIPIAGWAKILLEDYLGNRKKSIKKSKTGSVANLIKKAKKSQA